MDRFPMPTLAVEGEELEHTKWLGVVGGVYATEQLRPFDKSRIAPAVHCLGLNRQATELLFNPVFMHRWTRG